MKTLIKKTAKRLRNHELEYRRMPQHRRNAVWLTTRTKNSK